MPGLLDMLGGPGGLIGGISSIAGTIGAVNAAKQAARARELAIQQYQTAGLQGLEGNYLANQRGQYAGAGQGSDAILQGSRNLGSSLAAGGVYNPSVVAGAGLQQQQGLNTALADLGARNAANQQQGISALNQNVANMRLGVANQDFGNALGQQDYARQGLTSFLGSLAQNNLARSGANANRLSLPQQNGTLGQAPALPGNMLGSNPAALTDTQGQQFDFSTPSMMPPRSLPSLTQPYSPSMPQLRPAGYRPYSSLSASILPGR